MSEQKKRPLILVTNDDGYKAKGLLKLSEIAKEFGDVVVMSSSESQSGKSSSITIKEPIRYREDGLVNGCTYYIIKGTPADGVKLALNSLMDRKPDLLLSGINHGTNSSSSVIYSGTMGAAIEGTLHRIPSIGFSICDYMPDADFDASESFIRHLIQKTVDNGLPHAVCLNVNIPAVAREEIKGIKICRQTDGYWKEKFETRKDPRGTKYSWLSGGFINREPDSEDTDEWALANNYVSVVPVRIDLTAHDIIENIRSWEDVKQ